METAFAKPPDGYGYLISKREAQSLFNQAFPDCELLELRFVHKSKGIPSDIQYLATYFSTKYSAKIHIWAIPDEVITSDLISRFKNDVCKLICNQIHHQQKPNYSQNHDGYIAIKNNSEIYSFVRLNTYGLPTSTEWSQAIKTGKAKSV